MATPASLRVDGVLETCLYATELAAAERFYRDVIGLAVDARVEGRHVFFRCGAGMLLVFDPEATSRAAGTVGGVSVPTHGARGPGHVAFSVSESSLDVWRARLHEHGVAIEAAITWPRGGRSLYVRDPAGNSVELATPSMWGIAEEAAASPSNGE